MEGSDDIFYFCEEKGVLQSKLPAPGLAFVAIPNVLWDNGQVSVSKASIHDLPADIYTQKIFYSFCDGTVCQIKKVETIIQQWAYCVNLEFERADVGVPSHIRISFSGNGNSSFVGKQDLQADRSVTMTLGEVKSDQEEATPIERSVILHEWGHVLGLRHEHQVCELPTAFDDDIALDPY